MKMSKIPTKVSTKLFEEHIEPYLSKAKRGFISRISLEKIFNAILYKLSTGCQWKEVKVEPEDGKTLTYQAVYWHFRKWSKDGSLERVWKCGLESIKTHLDFSVMNGDASQTLAKKGGN